MSSITVVGGIYHESCIWPTWDQIYGSAGRAAAALSGHVSQILLRGYVRKDIEEHVRLLARNFGLDLDLVATDQTISFDYIHSLSVPAISPILSTIRANAPIGVAADVVLRFGMMEGSAVVDARCCVYDPQSAFQPEPFDRNGSKAQRLAIVGNRGEITTLGASLDPVQAARNLLAQGAEVVVVKSGVAGAHVVGATGATRVSSYRSDRVWKVGTGDVFAGIFAGHWGVHGVPAAQAADIASRAVAVYADTMSLPAPSPAVLTNMALQTTTAAGGRVYLAGPFFTIGQRWLVDDARRSLIDLGMSVFSPVHDVGHGPAHVVAPADIEEIGKCDAMFALLDGNDPGTIFEVGYARAVNKPVYALAQTVSEEDLKMVQGSGCKVFDDFVTCLHHLAWRI